MKMLLVMAFLLISSIVHGEDWTYINRDEKVNRFHMNARGKLHYDGQLIATFALQEKADRIGVSPVSPNGKHAVILSFGDQDSQLSLFKIDNRTTAILPLQGTPMVWQSWSPDSSYLVLSTYSDAENSLYVVPLSSGQPKKVPVQLHKSGEKLEYDTTTVTWSGPDRFQMEASVHCASGSPGCDSRAEEKPLRIYKLTVNASSLQVIPEEQPLPQEEM